MRPTNFPSLTSLLSMPWLTLNKAGTAELKGNLEDNMRDWWLEGYQSNMLDREAYRCSCALDCLLDESTDIIEI